jgi:dipeptidyl aminopeptidase/acylaminoacyl peptidase
MRRRTVFLGGLVALVVSAGALAALPRVTDELPKPLATAARLPERLWTRVSSPRLPKRDRVAVLTAPEQDAVRALAGRINARMVWSSNRSGNHELYLLDLREGRVRRLTNNPAVDFFSRFSPDGRQIVFVRSQREWVSARDPTAWDVYVIGVEGSGERRIAVGGYHPTWTADGTAVVFLRGTRLLRYDVATGQESLALDVANELPGVEEFGDAELAPDGRRWAFPLRGHFKGGLGLTGSFSGAAVLDPAARALILLTREQACQTTWAADGQRLLWVETGGHGGTRVMTGRPDGTGRQVFMDLPGAYSHEYFPKLSNDGRWLVWGAAAEGHEHDRADYETFVWEVGTPAERALRLTHHPGNDQWPDLWVAPRR